MPRTPGGTWDRHRNVWVAALGKQYSGKDGRVRRRNVVLAYEDGTPVGRLDHAGRLAALARLKAEAEAEHARTRAPTVAELFQRWVDWHRMHGSAETTIAGYRSHANRVCGTPWRGRDLGELPATDFDKEHLFAVRAALRGRGVSDGYIHAHDAAIKNCFRWASQAIEGRHPLVILNRNPFPRDSVRGVPAARSDRATPTWEQVSAILEALDRHADRPVTRGRTHAQREAARRYALAVRLLAERGGRPLEVIRLRVDQWEELDNGMGGFILGRHKTSKRGVAGVIPLSAATAARVRELIALPGRVGPWVFAPEREEGDPPSRHAFTAWWKANRGAAGAGKFELYSFRNCASNRLRLAGVEGRAMQLAMRHTTGVADTTYRRDRLAEAAKVWEAVDR